MVNQSNANQLIAVAPILNSVAKRLYSQGMSLQTIISFIPQQELLEVTTSFTNKIFAEGNLDLAHIAKQIEVC